MKAQAQWLAEVCEHQGDLTISSSMKLRTHVPLAQGLHILFTCLLFPEFSPLTQVLAVQPFYTHFEPIIDSVLRAVYRGEYDTIRPHATG